MRALLASSLLITACAHPKPPRPPASPTLDPAVLASICRAQDADATSHVYLGRDADGGIIRYSVTPRTSLADAGNLIFDATGKKLGDGIGSEVPWGDERVMIGLRAHEDQLNGGAVYGADDHVSCADFLPDPLH